MSINRVQSIGWEIPCARIISEYAVGSTDITNQAISLTSPGWRKHLRLLFLTSGLASGATLAVTIEAQLVTDGDWIEVQAFTINEAAVRDYLAEVYQVEIYKAMRFSVNKTGNSCLNVVDLSHIVGFQPVKEPDAAVAASSSPDEPLFAQLPT
jgi:hypothetical protein